MPPERTFAASDLLSSSFLGPWVRPPAGGVKRADTGFGVDRRQQIFVSLGNWYHAAKFMPHRPDLRDAILVCPTLKEAHKFALKHKANWRSDWQVVRHNVLVAGLAMMHLQRPEIGLAAATHPDIEVGLLPMRLPKSFVHDCFTRFNAWRSAPKVAVFGAESAPESVVGPRIAKLVSPLPTWTLVTSCNRRTPWMLHDWALYHFVPVEYHGSRTGRSGRDLAEDLVRSADQVVVFEQRRAKKFDRVIALAKAQKKRLALELYDTSAGDAGAQLPII